VTKTAGYDNTVSGSFHIMTPIGTAVADVLIVDILNNDPDTTAVFTDTNGTAIVSLPPFSRFELKCTHQDYLDMYIVGFTADLDFRYPTYVGTRKEEETVSKLLGFEYDPTRGWIVVGLDTPEADGNLIPAVGASANVLHISSNSNSSTFPSSSSSYGKDIGGEQVDNAPFIFDILLPKYGNTITNTSASFVTWANMESRKVGSVQVESPTGLSCGVSPAGYDSSSSSSSGSGSDSGSKSRYSRKGGANSNHTLITSDSAIMAYADSKTVMSYICL